VNLARIDGVFVSPKFIHRRVASLVLSYLLSNMSFLCRQRVKYHIFTE